MRTDVLLGLTVGVRNDSCGDGGSVKLLAKHVGWTEVYCPDCKQTTRLGSTCVLRGRHDIADGVAKRLNRRMLLAGT